MLPTGYFPRPAAQLYGEVATSPTAPVARSIAKARILSDPAGAYKNSALAVALTAFGAVLLNDGDPTGPLHAVKTAAALRAAIKPINARMRIPPMA
jgi:hypothetical protein